VTTAPSGRRSGDPPSPRRERHLRLPGTRNLRDVGGYPAGAGRETRWATLYRADALNRLPATSIDRLASMGLNQVIDLRWPHELVDAPSVFARHPSVAYHSVPLLDDDPTPEIGLAGVYRYIFDARQAPLVEITRLLLAPGGTPAVIGCAAGKDRTGVTIALLLAAVGVPHDVIARDYALSAEIFATPVDDEHLADWRAGPITVESPPEYMLAALRHLDENHGGARGFLRSVGLAEAEIEDLVERLTVEAPPATEA
jgi:protein-tyrosine phosphatase